MSASSPVGRPWRSVGTTMRPNTLLMCKLLLLLLVMHGFHEHLRDPYLPFLQGLDALRSPPGVFGALLHVVFWGAALALLFNVKVRTAAVVLGATVILVLVASKPVFRNHIFIVGCLLLLAGLHRRDEEPWLIPLQFSVMYLGAFVNKVLDPDWRAGQFMHYWLHDHLANPFYETFSPLFPEPGFGMLLSWTVIIAEGVLIVLFLVPRWRTLGVSLALVMHVSFLLVVGRRPFGHFTEDILIAMVAFLAWPREAMVMRLSASLQRLRPLWRFAHWDTQVELSHEPAHGRAWLELDVGNRTLRNGWGLGWFLKYNTASYVAIFIAFNGIAYLLSRYPF